MADLRLSPPSGDGPETVPEAFRMIAEWLDLYDKTLEDMVIMLELSDDNIKEALETLRGKSIQNDLRRWANEIETHENRNDPTKHDFVQVNNSQTSWGLCGLCNQGPMDHINDPVVVRIRERREAFEKELQERREKAKDS